MTIPAAPLLALYGISLVAAFGAWKMTVARHLARRAIATSS